MPTSWYEIHCKSSSGAMQFVERGDVAARGDARLRMYQERHPKLTFVMTTFSFDVESQLDKKCDS